MRIDLTYLYDKSGANPAAIIPYSPRVYQEHYRLALYRVFNTVLGTTAHQNTKSPQTVDTLHAFGSFGAYAHRFAPLIVIHSILSSTMLLIRHDIAIISVLGIRIYALYTRFTCLTSLKLIDTYKTTNNRQGQARQSVAYTDTCPYMGTDTLQTCRYSPLIAPPLHYHHTIRRMTPDYALTCLRNDILRYKRYPIQFVAHVYAHNPLAVPIQVNREEGRGRGETSFVRYYIYHPVKCVVKNAQNPLFMAYPDRKTGHGNMPFVPRPYYSV